MREVEPAVVTRRVYVTIVAAPRKQARRSTYGPLGRCLHPALERQDRLHVHLGVGVDAVVLNGEQTLVVARDRLLLGVCAAGQRTQDDHAGCDVVLGVEQVELVTGKVGGPYT